MTIVGRPNRQPWTLAALCLLAAFGIEASAQTAAGAIIDICDRTPQVRDGILAALELDDCATVPSARMAGLQRLDLGRKGIEALKAGDFGSLPALEQLVLQGNQLTTLPSGIFDNLPALRTMYLNNNPLDLKALQAAGAFDNMPALEILLVGGNQP